MQTEATVSLTADARGKSFVQHLLTIRKRWKLVFGISVFLPLFTAGVTFLLPNIYTAKVKFLPPQQQSGLLSAAMMQGALAAIGGDMVGESKTAKLYVEMLKVDTVRDPIIERFHLQQLYGKKNRDDVYRAMNNRVSITSGREGIITIAVSDEDPKRAAEMANAMVEQLKRLTTGLSVTGATNSKEFLQEEMGKARDELTKAEEGLKSFQARYKTADATQQAALSVSATAQLAAQLTAQEVQLSVLRRTYSDSSQTIKAMQQSISALKAKIGALQGTGGSAALPGFERIPERGQEYVRLMRRFKTAETVYEMLVRQLEMAKLNSDNDVSSIQMIQKAHPPMRKSKPERLKVTLIAFVIGVVFSVWLASFLENVTDEQRREWSLLWKR